jgi:hypothetical protein
MVALFLGALAVFIAGCRNIEGHNETRGWWQVFACIIMLALDAAIFADFTGGQ